MTLPALIVIGSFLVIQLDHADRLVAVTSASTASKAERAARALSPDIPSAVIVRVVNVACGSGDWPRRPGVLEVPIQQLPPDASVVIGAASNGDVVSVKAAKTLAAAYRVEHHLAPSIPRAVLGTVHARMLPDHRRPKRVRR